MATYPTLKTAYGSDPKPFKSIEVDRAEDGTARARSYGSDKVQINVKHEWLESGDLATLKAFYTANRLLSFDYTSPADGVARVCVFSSPIAYEIQPGNRTTAIVEMDEV
jgi:hypothetical protein